jgi:tetratricopeptide (TPR) repeat protein
MIFQWLNARDAETVASELADQFSQPAVKDQDAALRDLLSRADTESRLTRLNFYKKARFANSFKWRLLEKGIEPKTAARVTHSLIVHLSRSAAVSNTESSIGHGASASEKIPDLLRSGNKAFNEGNYKHAIEIYRHALKLAPGEPDLLNGLGASLLKTGLYREAEQHLRQAVAANRDGVEAHCNLGTLLRLVGNIDESEQELRRALKLRPNYIAARSSLGWTLIVLGRFRDARARFEKVLKAAPQHADALFGLGQIAKTEGRFTEAESFFRRALDVDPGLTGAFAALATLRKMTAADADWLKRARELRAEFRLSPMDEAELLFSIGKYHDDVGEFDEAFKSYQSANELMKTASAPYNRKGRDVFVDDLIRAYSKDTMATIVEVGADSNKPVFVLGMPRSGTSLTDQILASHPSIKSAGELEFWYNAVGEHYVKTRTGVLDATTRKKAAEDYLRLLHTRAGEGSRLIDKTPVNSDFIGIIYSVFPNARFIYLERDPIDTCLSCYFQNFVASMSYCKDLSDLAHYYKAHRRLMKHWQSVLPPESMLVVPYEGLVADQQEWTRKMLDFLGLEWDDRCLSFHETERPVNTASTWQVRQKIYTRSVGRWQSYKKFVGPLKALRS